MSEARSKQANFYVGIDLGTTNSVAAIGLIDVFTGYVRPDAVPVLTNTFPQLIVPSVVMYPPQGVPVVGCRAKDALKQIQPQGVNIIRSVKLQMGRARVSGLEDISPVQVSADILRKLKFGVEQRIRHQVIDVVVGVPACFDSDMCAATVSAAYEAGFQNVQLTVEPKAALLDFIYEQSPLAREARSLDLSEPRVAAIVDIGGGTTDVSIVQFYESEREINGRRVPMIHYSELGLSRFTRLAGDNFDRLVADYLAEQFRTQTGIRIDDLSEEDRRFANSRVLEYAESAKQRLTSEVDSLMAYAGLTLQQAMHQAAVEVPMPFLVGSHSAQVQISYSQFAERVATVLGHIAGHEVSLSDLDNPDIMKQVDYTEECSNMILPILDALNKARQKVGSIPKIDAVLVNGGMAKVHLVRQRLANFFGVDSVIEVPSPDLSVARGAVIQHYNTVHGLDEARYILPEAITLQYGDITAPNYDVIFEAGTEYPTKEPRLIDYFAIPRDRCPYFDLNLFRGYPTPTGQLAIHRIDFRQGRQPNRGERVVFEMGIDGNRRIGIKAWLLSEPNRVYPIEVKLHG
jgi:molecular chaperone DnaK (HSP70)